MVSSVYLKLLIFLPPVLIPACASSSLAFYTLVRETKKKKDKFSRARNLSTTATLDSLREGRSGDTEVLGWDRVSQAEVCLGDEEGDETSERKGRRAVHPLSRVRVRDLSF